VVSGLPAWQQRGGRSLQAGGWSGYFDQQHLAHEVQAIFGIPASALFSAVTSDRYKTRLPAAPDDAVMNSHACSGDRERPRLGREARSGIRAGRLPAAMGAS